MMIPQNVLDKIRQMCLLDDVLWEVAAKDKEMCQEILQVIINDKDLIVIEVHVQASLKSIYGRSVRVDTLCKLGNGTYCNIEIQKRNNDNHVKRVRYNSACVTTNISDPGTNFENIPDVYTVYISDFDIFHGGYSLYHVQKVVQETGTVVIDGQYDYYANTQARDDTEVAELMECFTQPVLSNPKFPKISARLREVKETDGGREAMCRLMDEYAAEYAVEYAAEKVAETAVETTLKNYITLNISKEQTVKCLMDDYGLSKEAAEQRYEERLQFYLKNK